MAEIAFIAPYEDLAHVARQVSQELRMEMEIYVARMEEGVRVAHEAAQRGCQVLVSRGVTASGDRVPGRADLRLCQHIGVHYRSHFTGLYPYGSNVTTEGRGTTYRSHTFAFHYCSVRLPHRLEPTFHHWRPFLCQCRGENR
ncbi:hypothetical protein V3F56_03990 [Moorellaceae bacterium AZ2]